LDEATSALDSLTEREVMHAINALSDGKTIVMIAHRLSTLLKCDRIVILNAGRVEAFGTWEELMSTSKTFQAMAKSSGLASFSDNTSDMEN
jgi:ABC-type multidrug transport system fused ATPase/permease subunit